MNKTINFLIFLFAFLCLWCASIQAQNQDITTSYNYQKNLLSQGDEEEVMSKDTILTLLPDTLDFGKVYVSESKTLEFFLTATDSLQDITINSSSPDFVPAIDLTDVEADTIPIKLSFNPSEAGGFQATVFARYEDLSDSIIVKGVGIEPVIHSSIDELFMTSPFPAFGNRTASFIVEGENLQADIFLASNSNFITLSHAKLGKTGGRVTVSFRPYALIDYDAEITISSAGAKDKTIIVKGLTHSTEINLQTKISNGFAYASSWNRDGNARSAAIHDDNFYIKDRNNKCVYQLNPKRGSLYNYAYYAASTQRNFKEETDPGTEDKNHYWAGWSVTAGNDGSLFASGNHGDYLGYAFGASFNGSYSPINIKGHPGRIDYFSLYGTTNKGKLAGATVAGLYTDEESDQNDVICIWDISGGKINKNSVNHVAKRNEFLSSNIQKGIREAEGTDICWIDEDNILITGAHTYPIIYNISSTENKATKINLPSTSIIGGGAYFTLADVPYLVLPNNSQGSISIFDISNPDKPLAWASSGNLGTTHNSTKHVSLHVNVNDADNKVEIYQWIPDIGYALYEITLPFVWSGDSDKDWYKNENWKYRRCPSAEQDVRIPISIWNYPLLTENIAVNSLTIDFGAEIDIAEYNIIVADFIDNQGTFKSSRTLPDNIYSYSGTVDFYGDKDIYIPKTVIFSNLKISTVKGITAYAQDFIRTRSLTLTPTATLDMRTNNLSIEQQVQNQGLIRSAAYLPAHNYGGIVEYYGQNNLVGPSEYSSFNILKINTQNKQFFAQASINFNQKLEIFAKNTMDMREHSLTSGQGIVDNQHILRSASLIPSGNYDCVVEFYGDNKEQSKGANGIANFNTLYINTTDSSKVSAFGTITSDTLFIEKKACLDMRSFALLVNDTLNNHGLLQTSSGDIPVIERYQGTVEYYGNNSDAYLKENSHFMHLRIATSEGGKVYAPSYFHAKEMVVLVDAILDMGENELTFTDVHNYGMIRTSDVLPSISYGGSVEYYGGKRDLYLPADAKFNGLIVSTTHGKKLYASSDLVVNYLTTSSEAIIDMLNFDLEAIAIYNSGTIMTSGKIPSLNYGGTVIFYGGERDLYTPEGASFTILESRMDAGFKLIMSSDLRMYILRVHKNAIFDIVDFEIFVTESLSNEGHIMTQNHLPYNILNFGGRVEYYGTGWQEIHAAKYHILHLNKTNNAVFHLAYKKEVIADFLYINLSSTLYIFSDRTVKVLKELDNPRMERGIVIQTARHRTSGTLIYHNDESKPVYATVEMYTYAHYTKENEVFKERHWQYFGIPFKTLTDIGNLFKGSFICKNNESGKGDGSSDDPRWIPLNESDNLYQFEGYRISQDKPGIRRFSGPLFNQSFTKHIHYSASGEYPGRHKISNPYTASISIKDIDFNDKMEEAVYMYTTGSYYDCLDENDSIIGSGCNQIKGVYAGQYLASSRYTAGIAGIANEIPAMQGFMVQTMEENCDCGHITVNYGKSMHNILPQRAPKAPQTDAAWLRIQLDSETSGDMLWLFANPETTALFDNGWDARKIEGDSCNPLIYSYNEYDIFQIDVKADIHETDIYFRAVKSEKEYSLTFEHGGGLMNLYDHIYLEDKELDLLIDISDYGYTYKFTSDQCIGSSRFRILTKNIDRTNFVGEGTTEVYVYSDKQNLYMTNFGKEHTVIELFDNAGRYIARYTCEGGESQVIPHQLYRGSYIVKISNSRRHTKKIMVL